VTVAYVDLADFVAIAAAATGLDPFTIMRVANLDLADSALGKAVGGAFRIAVFVLILVLAGSGERGALLVAGAIVFSTTYLYEARVTLAELHTGERPVR